jgi:periplasmic divalent cation tolerance protein
MNASFIYMTTGTAEEAHAIGKALVEEEFAACVNIVDGMQSIYRWDGQVCEAQEVVLIAKTRSDQVGPLIARVKELHAYECPCVLALPIQEGNPAYLEWIINRGGP